MIKLKPTGANLTIVILVAIFIIVFSPLALIWALNILFPVLAIPYSFDTWLAMFMIQAVLKSFVNFNNSEK